MKIYKEVEKLRKTKELIEHSCDICKQKSKSKESDNWGDCSRDVERVEIEYTSGTCYYGDSGGEVISFDICPDCFKDKIVSYFKGLGVEPTKYDY